MANLPRLYVPGRLGPGTLQVRAGEAKRLNRVAGLKVGDELTVFSGDGREYQASIASLASTSATLSVGALLRQEPAASLVVEIWCSLTKAKRFELAIEQCTEAGADIIRPLVMKAAKKAPKASAERWQQAAIEAAERSGRLFIPVIEPPSTLEERLGRHHGALIVADADGRSWDEARHLLPATGSVAVAIGPDDGFAEDDRARASQAGAVAVRFGPNRLRPETAAVAATTLLKAAIDGKR